MDGRHPLTHDRLRPHGPGCDHCYALTLAKRLKAMGQPKYQRDGDPRTSGPGFGLATHPDTLELPYSWAAPRTVFVNSMSDLFHPRVPTGFIKDVFAVMGDTRSTPTKCLPSALGGSLASRPNRPGRQMSGWG